MGVLLLRLGGKKNRKCGHLVLDPIISMKNRGTELVKLRLENVV